MVALQHQLALPEANTETGWSRHNTKTMVVKYSDSDIVSNYFVDQVSRSEHTVEILNEETATKVEFGVQTYQIEPEVRVSESHSDSNGGVGGAVQRWLCHDPESEIDGLTVMVKFHS